MGFFTPTLVECLPLSLGQGGGGERDCAEPLQLLGSPHLRISVLPRHVYLQEEVMSIPGRGQHRAADPGSGNDAEGGELR
jgi:hypothetical protein